jgi:hypothetical protein
METLTGFHKRVINPIEMMKGFGWPADHITVDDSIKPDYQIIRNVAHDGTVVFEVELLQNVLINLAQKSSYYKKTPPDFGKIKDVKYTVTNLRLATVFGNVDLPAGNYPGEKQRARIGVKCEYIY